MKPNWQNYKNYDFILSSSSPRRKDILQEIGLNFKARPPSADETFHKSISLKKNISNISLEKCLSNIDAGKISIGVDTIVYCARRIIGKPESYDGAVATLKLLNGRKHFVVSGVSLAYKHGTQVLTVSGIERTAVYFKNLSDEMMAEYLASIDYTDKAGAYAVQDNSRIIRKIVGDRSNVIGLPTLLLYRLLNKLHKKIRKIRQKDDIIIK